MFEQNIITGIEWYIKAIELGFAEASYALGKVFFEGKQNSDGEVLLRPNLELAQNHFEKAAAQNHPQAIEFLQNNYKKK